MECPICKKKIKIATWFDAVKRNGICHVISAEVKYNEDEESFDLSDLISSEIEKIEDFNEETQDLILFSFDPSEFTQEDVKSMQFGEEDLGARCNSCNASL